MRTSIEPYYSRRVFNSQTKNMFQAKKTFSQGLELSAGAGIVVADGAERMAKSLILDANNQAITFYTDTDELKRLEGEWAQSAIPMQGASGIWHGSTRLEGVSGNSAALIDFHFAKQRKLLKHDYIIHLFGRTRGQRQDGMYRQGAVDPAGADLPFIELGKLARYVLTNG